MKARTGAVLRRAEERKEDDGDQDGPRGVQFGSTRLIPASTDPTGLTGLGPTSSRGTGSKLAHTGGTPGPGSDMSSDPTTKAPPGNKLARFILRGQKAVGTFASGKVIGLYI